MPVFVLTHHEREPLTLSDTTHAQEDIRYSQTEAGDA
jgi:hypothetical protein